MIPDTTDALSSRTGESPGFAKGGSGTADMLAER